MLAIPILGICRGCQALNVARGGTLHQHLPDLTDGSIGHRQTASGRETTHTVRIEPGSRLAGIVGDGELDVNSFHHQAVDRLGRGLRAVAWAPDGVIEGIEGDGPALYLGVQWHVETLVDRERHAALFDALVESAAGETERRAA
jgi:putative glutamine amidotransferase